MQTCQQCIHVHYVEPHPWGSSDYGWGCLLTGGHADKVCGRYKERDNSQSYDPTLYQLEMLIPVANELKLYDAADYLQALVNRQKANEQ